MRKPWQNNNRATANSRDREMQYSQRRPAQSSFSSRSPINPFRSSTCTSKVLQERGGGFGHGRQTSILNSARRSNFNPSPRISHMHEDRGFNPQHRMSDVSMRDATPLKYGNQGKHQNTYGQERENFNPFVKREPLESYNPYFSQPQNVQQPIQNPFEQQQVRVNPFADTLEDRFKRTHTKLSMPKPVKTMHSENPFSKSKTSVPKGFNNSNPFSKKNNDKGEYCSECSKEDSYL